MLKRNIHQMDVKLREIEESINHKKKTKGYQVGISIDDKSTRTVVKKILNLNFIPNREETKEYIMDISEDKEKFQKFMDEMVYLTNEYTFPKRLEITEKTILENLTIFKENPIKILDVGVGATHSEHLKAITTIELFNRLNQEKINFEMYGGDVRINEFEKFNGINLFQLDVLNVKESLTNFHKEYGFNKFDVIRCSNLLGHFKKEKREIIKNNLIEISNEKALILFNTDYENIYTLYIKRKNEIKTKFIY